MASTRNKNTPSDYCLQQRNFSLANDYKLYQYSHSGKAYNTSIPSVGYTPSHMPRDAFSNNSIDIESKLFGINSTNLVYHQTPVVPDYKMLDFTSFFDRKAISMPNPLVVEHNNRPFPIPN
jgi:hypothetical protein